MDIDSGAFLRVSPAPHLLPLLRRSLEQSREKYTSIATNVKLPFFDNLHQEWYNLNNNRAEQLAHANDDEQEE